MLYLPVVSLKTTGYIFGKGNMGVALNGNFVVQVDVDKLPSPRSPAMEAVSDEMPSIISPSLTRA